MTGSSANNTCYCRSIAWVHSDHPEKLEIIDSWPEGGSSRAEKVPTLIKYENGGYKWGYQLDLQTKGRIEGVKLWLDPSQEKPLYVPPAHTQTELDRLGKPAIDVAADYIKAVYQHALDTLNRNYPKEFLEIIEKSFVLTVPAVWSDQAKNATMKAAEKAGISPISMIKEPEAAALYVLHEMKDKGLKIGDAFVICDASSGTVDLISYEITNLSPSLTLKELVLGKGGLAGSLMLNKRFEQYVKDVLGEREFAKLQDSQAFSTGVKINDNKKAGLLNNALTLDKKALDSIFEPLIKNIISLVEEQVSAVERKRMKEQNYDGVKAIFLVGGFGSNTYLRDRLIAANEGIQIYQPRSAWTAVVRGAALSKLPNQAQITSRIAVRHYGLAANVAYDESIHAGQTKTLHAQEQRWKVEEMTWFIAQGDDLSEGKDVSFPFYRCIWCDSPKEDFVFKDTLLACEQRNAPKFPKKNSTFANCSLTADLSKVPTSLFKVCSSPTDGRNYWRVNYNIALTAKSAEMTYRLVFKGKSYGQVTAEY